MTKQEDWKEIFINRYTRKVGVCDALELMEGDEDHVNTLVDFIEQEKHKSYEEGRKQAQMDESFTKEVEINLKQVE